VPFSKNKIFLNGEFRYTSLKNEKTVLWRCSSKKLLAYTVKKSLAIFPSPAGMSLTKPSLARNIARKSDIPAGDGKIANL
jgi:hypothetical protein